MAVMLSQERGVLHEALAYSAIPHRIYTGPTPTDKAALQTFWLRTNGSDNSQDQQYSWGQVADFMATNPLLLNTFQEGTKHFAANSSAQYSPNGALLLQTARRLDESNILARSGNYDEAGSEARWQVQRAVNRVLAADVVDQLFNQTPQDHLRRAQRTASFW